MDKSPYDGQMVTYTFGDGYGEQWRTTAESLAKAIRKFRAGVLFPHGYVERKDRIPTEVVSDEGYRQTKYLSSKPGAKIPVVVWDNTKKAGTPTNQVGWVEVARIDPEGPEAEERRREMLPPGLVDQLEADPDTKALATVDTGSALVGLDGATRKEIEQRLMDLEARRGELEALRRDLALQIGAMHAEMKKRLEQIWVIELYLGTQEEIHQIAEGEPAPGDTKITIHQRTLCMDEEIAIYDWLHDVETVGDFDFTDIQRFDEWVRDPEHLALILPEPKGIVALKVRRHKKDYHDAITNVLTEALNAKTYLLIRNGGNLYRVWADVNLWPRFFPRTNEFDWLHEREHAWPSDVDKARDQRKNYLAGVVAVQGLLDRSHVFYPLPAQRVNLFDAFEAERYCNILRDDDVDHLLPSGDPLERLTWRGYVEWLRDQVRPGSRVLWTAIREYEKDALYHRTYLRTVLDWPTRTQLYVVEPYTHAGFGYQWAFLYDPKDEVYHRYGQQMFSARARRVRFRCYKDEVVAYDAMSWRVVRHLLLDRGQREHYQDYFKTLGWWFKTKKAEAKVEAPFVDLVLQRAGVDPGSPDSAGPRARVERLVRWWKLKTKEHRDLGSDEAKALRMIEKAYRAGQDYDDDPERSLLQKVVPS